ncbi:hypothetical protein P152DRAFT_456394 [Eremomyces bilateralis CBS 781.70]|uniref:peptidylprolyl isomerase n=1 Tax=Eremomyces bilateralis CBS 781.70 TaxID=1392243 RepID=A0A6G1G809_9PEZI|nr:uncharacterized protein P152DRAFT_456394 [Eremomyces bilateralis CBS 781.70]KAF1814164.1 hypothetical protein P152DRAFT_456394 [Eremomyces bilateralis CBS 781.70]
MHFSTTLALTCLASVAMALDKPLDIKITNAGECTRKTVAGDKIQVHYRGSLEDGTEFDASYNRGQPLGFAVGTGQVIKGWDQGLFDMCPGDKRTLTVQPEWAYGDRDLGVIPPNSVLIFETELVEIEGVEKETVEKVEEKEEKEEL